MPPAGARLGRGDLVPHFTVTDAAGRRVSYADGIWQRCHLVLVTVPAGDAPAALERFSADRLGADAHDVACVVTADAIAGVPPSGFLVADRWGEIAVAQHAASPAGLPGEDDARAWVRFVQQQCPECQGEAR